MWLSSALKKPKSSSQSGCENNSPSERRSRSRMFLLRVHSLAACWLKRTANARSSATPAVSSSFPPAYEAQEIEREIGNATTLFMRFGVVLLRLSDGDVPVETDA
jgi:hypothetical protein